MAVNSKQKGARFERQLAGIFKNYGYKDSEEQHSIVATQVYASDVIGLPGIHVEAKHQEKMYLYDWMDQAKRDVAAGGRGKLPVVFHKKNHAEILVTMTLDDWMTIYREYEAGMAKEEEVGTAWTISKLHQILSCTYYKLMNIAETVTTSYIIRC